MRPAATAGATRFAWQPGDAVGVLWTGIGGLAALVVSYIGVSGTDARDTQTVWIAVGIGGVLLAAVGNAVWLAAGARAVATRRRAVIIRLEVLTAGAAPVPVGPVTTAATTPTSAAASPTGGVPVATTAMTRYHRPDCLLVRGKPVEPAEVADHHALGRQPCGVCRPDRSR